jgi:ribosomal-protein-alanine N-acetyltransferase
MSTIASVAPASLASILPATWRDLNAVRHIEIVCFPQDAWPIWDIIGVLTLPNVVRLKAMVDSLTVGFLAADLRQSEKTAWIATIGVLPEYRRGGIGADLLKTCEASVTLPRLRLNVRISNEDAIRLYKTLGYYQVGLWPGYYQDREDALILEKQME